MKDDMDAMSTLGLPEPASLHQVHGPITVVVTSAGIHQAQADGMITTTKNLPLIIRMADCQNFVAYDPVSNTLGVLHAGWRGVRDGAIPAFIRAFLERGSDAKNLLVCAGPSLCTAHAEFTNPPAELPNIDPKFFQEKNVKLRAIADDQLLRSGVLPQHMERMADCTKCQNDLYYSYRGIDHDTVASGAAKNMIVAWLT